MLDREVVADRPGPQRSPDVHRDGVDPGTECGTHIGTRILQREKDFPDTW